MQNFFTFLKKYFFIQNIILPLQYQTTTKTHTTMTAQEILSTNINRVDPIMRVKFFDYFTINVCKLDEEQADRAWNIYTDLFTFEISLNLALNTAVAMAKY